MEIACNVLLAEHGIVPLARQGLTHNGVLRGASAGGSSHVVTGGDLRCGEQPPKVRRRLALIPSGVWAEGCLSG